MPNSSKSKTKIKTKKGALDLEKIKKQLFIIHIDWSSLVTVVVKNVVMRNDFFFLVFLVKNKIVDF